MLLPKLVIFDMDDVLCHYDLGRRLRHLAALADTTARDVRAAVWDSGFEELADAGGYPDPENYLKEFGERLGYAINLEQWVEARRIAMSPNIDVLNIAQTIGQQAQIAIYTNNGPIVKNNLESLFPEAAAIFQSRFCSYQFGTKKPDPEAFTRLVTLVGQPASDCWFIDDKRSNVQGARLAGLRGHHFVSAEALIAEAQQIGFKI
ncbi:MAG: HAD family phosphatase [Alphaproteobacteria bacterium]|nr:HAD family phosphatase [Alphaproteobacteria bacterium]